MCLGKEYVPHPPNSSQIIFELHGFKRCLMYAIVQIIFIFIGLVLVFSGPFDFLINAIIGGIVIITFCIAPNGRFPFLNLQRIGREYIMFDESEREVSIISSRFAGMKYSKSLLCSFSQFRGIAVHYKTKKVLLLCKREESLLLKQSGDHRDYEKILEEMSLYWFGNHSDRYSQACFFGITYLDFSDGIVAEGNVSVEVDYDYYLKRGNTKIQNQKNLENIQNFGNNKDKHQHHHHHDKDKEKDYVSDDIGRFNSVKGAVIDIQSDDDIQVHDYV